MVNWENNFVHINPQDVQTWRLLFGGVAFYFKIFDNLEYRRNFLRVRPVRGSLAVKFVYQSNLVPPLIDSIRMSTV